jgi:DNA-binding CsgD family transcriptional regulator
VDGASERRWQTLLAQPTTSETALSLAGLTDLMSTVGSDVLDELPRPQRRALDIALLRADPDGPPPDHRSLAAAFRSVLLAVARRSPLVVAVDDAQWLDAPSARIIGSAFRRFTTESVGIVVTARLPDQPSIPFGLDRALPENRLVTVPIGPLGDAALLAMIEDRVGTTFPKRVVARIAASSAGNPFFALEIARAVVRRGTTPSSGEDLPIPPNVSDLVAQRIAGLSSQTRTVLIAVAASGDPTIELLDAVVGPDRARDAVDDARVAGVVEVEEGRVRFTHPLLAAAVWSSTPPDERERVHRVLAELIEDPEKKALHLAALTSGPDEEIASVLTAAARRARTRGAPDAAVDLFEQAIRLTPATGLDQKWRRSIDAAQCHASWRDDDRARALLEGVVAEAPAGAVRSEALLHLGNIRYRLDNAFSAITALQQARDEAGDDRPLRSAIESRLAYMVAASGNAMAGLDHAKAALDMVDGTDDDAALAEALAHLTITEFLLGNGVASEQMARAVALEEQTAYPLPPESRPSLINALILLWTDEAESALVVLDKLRHRLEAEGDESGLPYTNWVLGWAESATGNLARAALLVDEGIAAAREARNASLEGMLLGVSGEVHAWLGNVERARADAQAGLDRTMQMGIASGMAFSTSALGFLELSSGDAQAAHERLGPLANLMVGMGIAEPGLMRFLPDEIEALVALGELDEAERLLDGFESKATAVGRGVAIATSGRCRGLLASARGDAERASSILDAAAEAHRRLPYVLELGRTLVAKGRVQRRRRQKAAAQASLSEAISIFERCGARLWEHTARAELERVGGRTAVPSELTATERRVAELAASGLTNREVAEAAFMSPKTVEGVLGRVYRKLGISSRAELGAQIGSPSTRADPSQ